MSKQELEQKIKDLCRDIFMVEVADHLSSDDYNWLDKKKAELRELQHQLQELDA